MKKVKFIKNDFFVKKSMVIVMIMLLSGSWLSQMKAQDRTVYFDVNGAGVSKPITWGLDLAWLSESNIRRGIAFMGGTGGVDVVRSSFMPTNPLNGSSLQGDALTYTNQRISIINTWLGSNTKVVMNLDAPTIDASFVGNATNFASLIDVTRQYYVNAGRTVYSVAPLNEPDYSTQNGSVTDFYNILGVLRNNSNFNNIRLCGANTLNCDVALTWYNQIKARLDEGNTHQLAGSFDNYANFFQTVRSNGDYATNDELHNVMEAMVGVEYGMQTGIWWYTAEYARGEFCKASDGVRLGYAEHRTNWTAASVYRAPSGKVQAFLGGSERQAATTTYRFISQTMDVFFDGQGPQREFTITYPGGAVGSYQNGQTNAERVINITWGEDIQPVINGCYVLVNRNSGKVLDVSGASTDDGTNIHQWTYLSATNQQWNVNPVDPRIGGDFSYYSIKSVQSGKSLDVSAFSLDNGGNVQLWTDGQGTNQQWYLEYAGDGWFYIRSRNSAKCLDVDGLSTANGGNVQQWEVVGGTNQQWRFLPVDASIEFTAPNAPTNLTGTGNSSSISLSWTASSSSDVVSYTIFRKESGGAYNTLARNVTSTTYIDSKAESGKQYYYKVKAIDKSLNRSSYSNEVGSLAITGSSAEFGNGSVVQLKNRGTGLLLDGYGRTTNGSVCSQYANTTHINSQWRLISTGVYYQLQNVATGMYLDGEGLTANGSDVKQYANTTHVNSQWSVQQYSGEYYRLQNRGTGLFLDGMGRTTNGSACGQYANTTHVNAQWDFITVVKSGSNEITQDISEAVKLYPNPVTDILNIELSDEFEEETDFYIYDNVGRLLQTGVIQNNIHAEDISSLAQGIYIVRLSNNNKTVTKRISVK